MKVFFFFSNAWQGNRFWSIHLILTSFSLIHRFVLGRSPKKFWRPVWAFLTFFYLWKRMLPSALICICLRSTPPNYWHLYMLCRETQRQRERCTLVTWCMPPVKALIVMRPLLLNSGLLIQCFSGNFLKKNSLHRNSVAQTHTGRGRQKRKAKQSVYIVVDN